MAADNVNDIASIWTPEKEWQTLPGGNNSSKLATGVYAVSTDGKMLAGYVDEHSASDGFGTKAAHFAVFWTYNSNGGWNKYEELPSLNENRSARCPQPFDVLCISAYKKALVGRNIDWSGTLLYPLVYKRDGDKLVMSILYEDISQNIVSEKPKYPRNKPIYPDVTPYLTDSEKSSYEEALKRYDDSIDIANQDWTAPCPSYDPSRNG